MRNMYYLSKTTNIYLFSYLVIYYLCFVPTDSFLTFFLFGTILSCIFQIISIFYFNSFIAYYK